MTDKTDIPVNTTHYYGACPECACTDGYMNVSQTHWFVCDRHMTRWSPGFNLFSDWRNETEADWRSNAEKLDQYCEVEPLPMVEAAEETE
jgi:hypothetical protein